MKARSVLSFHFMATPNPASATKCVKAVLGLQLFHLQI
jgi:hypothetical protein